MIGIAIAFVLAVVFGVCFYWARRLTGRTPDQMRRFLDRRFDIIRRKGFWGEQRDYIDEVMIKHWGYSGWLLILPPSFNLSLSIDQIWSVGGLSSVLILVFAGMFFGDSRAGVYFMRSMGIAQYKKEVEQSAS
jgi:protein-S-isoprenylcysteine O-methyltransferase Ste14